MSELDVGDPSANLRGAAISGLRWSSMARLVVEVVAFASSIVLARLISPAEFGRAAVALSLAGIVPILASQGFGAPLIQVKRLERRVAEGAFFLGALTGIGLGLFTVFVLAPYVFTPIFGRQIAVLVQQTAPIIVLAGIGTVPNALLQRSLGFARLAQIEVGALLAGIVASVVLAAVAGLEAEALVAGANATALLATIATLVSAPRVRPRWRRGSLAGVTRFGSAAALSSLSYEAYKNVDYWILAVRLPVRDVGLYWRAYQLGIEYQTKITRIMLRLAFPLYARSTDLEQMRRMRRKIVRVDSVAVFPLLAVLIVTAPAIVPFLYGDRWDAAVVPTQILAFAGMAVAAGTGTGPLMLALGKPGALFVFDLFVLVGYAGVIYWVSDNGLVTVCIAVMLFQFAILAAQYSILERRYLGVPLRVTWGAIVPASVATAVALLLALPAAQALQDRGHDMLVAAGLAALVLLSYAVTLRVLFPAIWSETLGIAGAVLRGPPRRSPPVVQPAGQAGPPS